MLIKKTYTLIAGALNKNFIGFSKKLQKCPTTFNPINIFVKKKNGNRDGSTALTQITSPLKTEFMYLAGFTTIQLITTNKKIAKSILK